MQQLQHTFKSSYVARLKDELRSGASLEKYGMPEFEFDRAQVKSLANVYHPDSLLEKMQSADSDFGAAKALYEAYKGISPLLASSEPFWVYLAHTELFPYCQQRWPGVLDGTAAENYVLDHWFFSGNGMMRNALANLWWSAYFSYDDTREDPYELTEVLFKNSSFRIVWFNVFLRLKQGLLGVLGFLKDNPELLGPGFEIKGRYIAQYINRLGGVRQLAYLPREFFYDEMTRIKDDIALIESEADLRDMLGQS